MTSQYSAQMAHRRGLTFWVQWLCAMTLVNLLLIVLVHWRIGELPSEYRLLIILTVLGSMPVYGLVQVYHKRHGLLVGLGRLLAGWLILLGLLMSIAFVTQTSALFSRQVVIVWAVVGFLPKRRRFCRCICSCACTPR